MQYSELADEQIMGWLHSGMPQAVDPTDYGPSFADDVNFSPWVTDQSSSLAAAATLNAYGGDVLACYFGKGFTPRSFQVHVVFRAAVAGEACDHYRGLPDKMTLDCVRKDSKRLKKAA